MIGMFSMTVWPGSTVILLCLAVFSSLIVGGSALTSLIFCVLPLTPFASMRYIPKFATPAFTVRMFKTVLFWDGRHQQN